MNSDYIKYIYFCRAHPIRMWNSYLSNLIEWVRKSSVSVSVSDLISKYFCRDNLRQKKYNVGTLPANKKKIVGTLLEVLVLLREESQHFFLFCQEKSQQNINFVETYLDKKKTPIPGNSRTRLGGHIGFSTKGRSTEGEGLNLIFLIYIQ